MKYRKLGRINLECSEIALGTWAFASMVYGNVTQKDAQECVAAALDNGINFFDSAPLYGDQEENGIAEKILGTCLGGKLNDVIISTKFGRYANDGGASNFHAARARESVEGSLKRLGRDYIDVLFFHSPFSKEEIHDDVWAELGKLKDEGKVLHIGHSISKFEDTESLAREWARERKIDCIQVVYSLMNREAKNLIEDLYHEGVGVVARECLANGFLTGAINRDTVFPENNLNNRYSREQMIERVEYVESLGFLVRDDVKTVAQSAMRWILDHPSVSVVLTGAKNREEIEDCAAASNAQSYTPEELEKAIVIHKKDFPAA